MNELDAAKKMGVGGRSGDVSSPGGSLTFQSTEESLDGRVVRTAIDTAHIADQIVAFPKALESVTRKLTIAIGVQDQRVLRVSLP